MDTDTLVRCIDTIQIPHNHQDLNQRSSDREDEYDSMGQRISCIDTDNSFLYVGTSSGYVLVYALSDLMNVQSQQQPLSNFSDGTSASASITSHVMRAAGHWRAAPTEDCAITSIRCGVGPGTLGRHRSSQSDRSTTSSSVLYTGDAHGTVKQWEVLKMISSPQSNGDTVESVNDDRPQQSLMSSPQFTNQYRVEAWPKLATQRLSKRAHVFRGHSHAITALLSIDALKFVSASADGTGRSSLIQCIFESPTNF
jgi:hypothetical protein